jgi:hypothetical protein
VALEIGQPAPEVVFLAEGDREVPLASLWRDAPVVLVFLRHFG